MSVCSFCYCITESQSVLKPGVCPKWGWELQEWWTPSWVQIDESSGKLFFMECASRGFFFLSQSQKQNCCLPWVFSFVSEFKMSYFHHFCCDHRRILSCIQISWACVIFEKTSLPRGPLLMAKLSWHLGWQCCKRSGGEGERGKALLSIHCGLLLSGDVDMRQGGMESSGGSPHLLQTMDPCVFDSPRWAELSPWLGLKLGWNSNFWRFC